MRIAFFFLALTLGYATASIVNPAAVSEFVMRTRWDSIVSYLFICLFWAAWATAFRVVVFIWKIVLGIFIIKAHEETTHD